LGKNQILTVEESIEKEGLLHTEIDGQCRVKYPHYRELLTFLMRYTISITNDKEEPVTGQDGLRVMQIIEAAIKVVLRKKQLIYSR
jgi:predicted dehydrogenase